MTFEDAIRSLGAEFGVDLEPEDGAVSFAIAGDDGDSVDIVVREAEDRESADISADLGELPAAGGDALLLELASPPGGFDALLAQNIGLRVLAAPGLPGKSAPASAAALLRRTVERVMSEQEE